MCGVCGASVECCRMVSTARQRSTSKSQRDSAQRAATARQRSTGSPQRDSAQRAAHSATVCTLSHSVLQRDSAQRALCATARQRSTGNPCYSATALNEQITARQRDSATALNTGGAQRWSEGATQDPSVTSSGTWGTLRRQVRRRGPQGARTCRRRGS